jgi:hypothetical protein
MNDGTVVIPGNTTIRNTNAYPNHHVIDTQAIIEAIIFGPTDIRSRLHTKKKVQESVNVQQAGGVLAWWHGSHQSIINHKS